MAFHILGPIHNVYAALHQDTDSAPTRFSAYTAAGDPILFEPSSYPVCNAAGHIREDSASTPFVRTAIHDNITLASAPLSNTDDAPSSSVPTPLHVVKSPTTVSPLHNLYHAHQTTIQSLRTPVTSPDPATIGAIRNIVTSGMTTSHTTSETSTSASSLSSTPPPVAVDIRDNLDLLAPSNTPNLPPSASFNPALDNTLPAESRRSIMVTIAPDASPRPTSTSDLGAAAKDDGSPQPGSRKEKDALDHPSVNRAISTKTMTDLPPQPPSLLPDTDSDAPISNLSLFFLPGGLSLI
ncbi:hypothetical protein EDB84DRAFT_52951 [Lactarius hengduanensis]|nr:hypothetical protein EDB84DRAFT_52951 [Lactarius hengduanensis]